MKTFQEILPDFLAGKKIRRKSWEPQKFYEYKIGGNKYVDERGDGWGGLSVDMLETTDWELYKEPAPEPAEKTPGQELYEIYESVFGSTGIAWNDREATYRDRYEIIAQRFEPKVLSRHWFTMQKMVATTPVELLIKNCYEKGWGWKDAAATIESEVLRRHRESLPKIEGKTAGQVLLECDETNSLYGLKWEHLKNVQHLFEKQAAAFLSAYQLLPQPEPKAESAILRLYNSGFENIELRKSELQCSKWFCTFKFNGRYFDYYALTPEFAAAGAFQKYENSLP